MKKNFILISTILAMLMMLGNAPVAFAADDSDDPLVEGLPDGVQQPKKKNTSKKTTKNTKNSKNSKGKKNTKKTNAKKKPVKKEIYVDEYKFKTDEFESEPVSYKFNKAGNPIVSVKAGESKTRTFGQDYTKYWKPAAQPSIKTKNSKNNTKKYSKPNAFDDQSKSTQSDELTLPDGLGQPNGLIAVDPILNQ